MQRKNFREVVTMKETEKRCYGGQEFRTADSESEKIIEGHAAIFEQRTNIGGIFYEVIERGAFDETSLRDVPLFVNHDAAQIPLARSRRNNGNSSMTLTVDEKGLAIRARLDVENNPAARALYSAVERGDLDAMSFCFTVADEEWQDLNSEMPTRRIKKFSRIFEISAVNFPAYETDLHARAVDTLENAKRALEKAHVQSLENDKAREIEILRLKNRILGGI